jgi:hypothetical protein
MGTIVYRATKAQAVADELRDIGIRSEVLGHRLKGSRLWVLAQVKTGSCDGIKAGTRWISLSLVKVQGSEIAIKRLDETCSPCYYDCPLAFLEMAIEPECPYAGAWREKVRAFHAQHALERRRRRHVESGSRIAYGGDVYQMQRSLGRRGWEVLRERDQCPMRMTARQFGHCQWLDLLGDAVTQPAPGATSMPATTTTSSSSS